MSNDTLQHLLDNNRRWSAAKTAQDTDFFRRLARQQKPQYLWIGCADSRVPANEIIGLDPGEVFVHRNVGNLVEHTDMNCLSVIQYAVEVLQVQHVIVCGHYGCGAVQAALSDEDHGLIDNWLRKIQEVYRTHREEVDARQGSQRLDYMCELNIAAQVANVCRTTVVQNAWRRGQKLCVHGWVYSLKDGLLHNIGLSIDSPEQLPC
ncbi:MAG TPA: carbonate dehydratase [Gammaproteobacteria bacterium]|nr:carbonate dehydratase [Gammaproteobacteria bacterium]